MMKLLREFMAVALLAVVPISVFGQRRDQDKRPPKEPGRVVTQDKDRRPPPPPRSLNRPRASRRTGLRKRRPLFQAGFDARLERLQRRIHPRERTVRRRPPPRPDSPYRPYFRAYPLWERF